MANINLLFTCPHDGRKSGLSAIPPMIKRDLDNFPNETCLVTNGQGFSIENDLSTKELTEKIVKNIKLTTTKSPYVQTADYRRQYIDYNRKEECAFVDSGSAGNEYMNYHNGIKGKIETMLSNDSTGLAFLFDIHGTGRRTMRGSNGQSNEIEIIIGTQQGETIRALTEGHPRAWCGDNGLIPLLQARKGIKVWPPNASEEADSTLLDGGYTIQKYSEIDRVVAIQIEVICALRENVYCSPCRDIFAADLAECITDFVSPFTNLG